MKDMTSEYKSKKFSILADSISTFSGYNHPDCEIFYDAIRKRESGVLSYSDTWWGRALDRLGAELLINNSFSGSTVTRDKRHEIESYASGDTRIKSLANGALTPDVIMVFMGMNDWLGGAPLYPEDAEGDIHCFSLDYKAMIEKLKREYPSAEIWCLALPARREGEYPDEGRFLRYERHINEFCEVIREVAHEYSVKLIDIYDPERPFETFDGYHPSYRGMATIADAVLGEIYK